MKFHPTRRVCRRTWLALLFFTPLLLQAAPFTPDVRPGPGVTQQGMLSDYFPPLRGGPMDTAVFILDSGLPGATGLMIGGTHGNSWPGRWRRCWRSRTLWYKPASWWWFPTRTAAQSR